MKYVHSVEQPSPPSISRIFLSSQAETPHSLICGGFLLATWKWKCLKQLLHLTNSQFQPVCCICHYTWPNSGPHSPLVMVTLCPANFLIVSTSVLSTLSTFGPQWNLRPIWEYHFSCKPLKWKLLILTSGLVVGSMFAYFQTLNLLPLVHIPWPLRLASFS